MTNLKNKIVFITGASSGIGRSTAYVFAKHGAKLIIAARRLGRIKKIAQDIMDKYSTEVLPLKIDVQSFPEVKATINKIPYKWKNIDILVNNAGLSRGLNKIQNGVLKDWEEMIDTNVKGLLYVSKEVIPFMLKRKSGHIINVGSIAGHEVYPGGNVYCATKHAVDGITKSMRIDLNKTPIRVSTIDPGLVETEFSLVRYRGDKEKAKTAYIGMQPLSPEDVAEAIEFIATRNTNTVVAEMLLLPKAQASSTIVNRK
ncbi:SDR family NAD(P)-dependent oxidoreductase [Bacteroidota bacterium]